MHRVISINQAVATRTIQLENIETGTIDMCFDDSSITTYKDFGFIEIGKEYDCKIVLIGDIICGKCNQSVSCEIVDLNAAIGEKTLVQVGVDEDTYYLPRSGLEECIVGERIEYIYTRKDLVQVNDVIHGDLLTTLW
ncbi:MAG: hypothetical protein LUG13_05690 [Oscillospiraceae bacterium]|nr:hypothetical protein [Oscillospiraceae bacterium]